MSPFLFFSNEKRGIVQSENPDMKITEVSAKLGEMWRLMSDEEKKPYVERSRIDRDRYRSQQNEFKGKLAARGAGQEHGFDFSAHPLRGDLLPVEHPGRGQRRQQRVLPRVRHSFSADYLHEHLDSHRIQQQVPSHALMRRYHPIGGSF